MFHEECFFNLTSAGADHILGFISLHLALRHAKQ